MKAILKIIVYIVVAVWLGTGTASFFMIAEYDRLVVSAITATDKAISNTDTCIAILKEVKK